MKAKTKIEKEVAAINATLSESIALADAEWMKNIFVNESKDNPSCMYFDVTENISGWECKRLYRIHRITRNKRQYYAIYELLRLFINGTHRVLCGKSRTMGYYFDSFAVTSLITLKSDRKNYYGYKLSDLFDMSQGSKMCDSGIRIRTNTTNTTEIRKLLRFPYYETLFTQHDPLADMLHYFNDRTEQYLAAIKIAKRHGFKFTYTNIPLWFDMVRGIVSCGYDYRSPHYVAPVDFMATHNRFCNMYSRMIQRRQLENRYSAADELRKKFPNLESLYIKERERFFDLFLSDGLVNIRVLESVDEFREEAFEMQHCVYSCQYWNLKNHPHSLILSATINGVRCETIEVNLEALRVVQSYGKHDTITPFHDRIVELVNNNMELIQNLNHQSKTKAA